MTDVRFSHGWKAWAEARTLPGGTMAFLRSAPSEQLVALLASRPEKGQEEARNAIATVLLNRLQNDPHTARLRTHEIKTQILTSGRLARAGHELALQARALIEQHRV